ncbi:TauD/TfdA family dioxygenase [Amycolatopsis keratiniphila]|uniref:TauD/TfdA-like domain-containing protein n=1 Tax=Amycolatopsis keratiniphila subsp. keratiniphila TaxID=227715 RepID=A0A1W2M1L9_9PSEU|nr:TauD/TfdA family dioxygenase [Amycolatopsis keratiniphila]OLZ52703.1 hypothetical protein BS330_22685 [Amycolatopsis keratiniphila subsp. nogabecina]ONF73755.1 hypothetical protein AVR91_0206550 [Amycolatopsis keratiniphila subsp. keratiniphila]SDU09867.1 Taurine dioxygenase, alpha-ketoglutarate-dependent [Amycolatopsis keratiniphila]
MTVPALPLVVEGGGEDIVHHLRDRRTRLREALVEHGALLLRGFQVNGVDGFEAAVRELSGAALAYSERSSPRTVIKGNVYTSTDYPPQEEIFLHNENSYQAVWPLVLYFHCVEPPHTRGATPLADTRRVHEAIDPAVREEFSRRRWMVVRNYSDEVGLHWREAFGTDSPDEVSRYCAENGIVARWRDRDHLRTEAVRDAVHRHPVTGLPVWFNHATVFHVTTLPEPVRLGLLEMYGEEGLPSNTYYGDGAPIPDVVTEHLRSCYRSAAVRFDYHRDDVLVVDNMRTAHGREPFTGPRRIAVAMAEPSRGPDGR